MPVKKLIFLISTCILLYSQQAAAHGKPVSKGPRQQLSAPLHWNMEQLPTDLQAAIEFHGHLCSGLLKGYKALKYAQEQLQSGTYKGAKLTVVVENRKCGVDAIQRLSRSNSPFSNTAGNGMRGLLVFDYGKDTWIFLRNQDRKALRLSLIPDALDHILQGAENDGFHRMKRRFMMGMITDEKDQQTYMKRMNKKARAIIALPYEKLFTVKKLSLEAYNNLVARFPSPASRLPRRFICQVCGEGVINYYGRFAEGKAMCIPCYKQIKAQHQQEKQG